MVAILHFSYFLCRSRWEIFRYRKTFEEIINLGFWFIWIIKPNKTRMFLLFLRRVIIVLNIIEYLIRILSRSPPRKAIVINTVRSKIQSDMLYQVDKEMLLFIHMNYSNIKGGKLYLIILPKINKTNRCHLVSFSVLRKRTCFNVF